MAYRQRRLFWSNQKCFYGILIHTILHHLLSALILFIYYALVMLVSVLMCFWSSKKGGKGKRPGKGGNRFWKSIGLGFKTPRDAIEGKYNIHFYFMFQIRTFYFAPIGFMLLLWLSLLWFNIFAISYVIWTLNSFVDSC